MKRIITTNPTNIYALIARLTLGIVVFPHGAQKLLGWFGGNGFEATMTSLTTKMELPWIIAFLVILIESIGSLLLIMGLITRVASLGILVNFIGVVLTTQMHNGFFMNWSKVADKGEGLEYFILLFGLAIITLIAGGGKGSADAIITKAMIKSNQVKEFQNLQNSNKK